MITRIFLCWLGTVVLLIGLAACARSQATQEPLITRDAEDIQQPSYVGEVSETEAFIGIALLDGGTRIMAYVCDIDPEMTGGNSALAEWFKGDVRKDGTIDLTSKDVRLKASVNGDTITGTFEWPSGAVYTFEAMRTESPAGLYREEQTVGGSDYVAGWIVLPDGEERGLLRTIHPCMTGDEICPTPPPTPKPR